MVTTGAAPRAEIIKAIVKNHPEKAILYAGAVMAGNQLPAPMSNIVLSVMQNQPAMQHMIQKQYFSNIKSAVSAKNHWKQTEKTNGND